MLVGKVLPTLNDLIEVDFHVIGHQVHVSEFLVFGRVIVDEIEKMENVLVFHGAEYADFPEHSFGINFIFDLMKLLDGHFLQFRVGLVLVDRQSDMAVGTSTQEFLDFVSLSNVELDAAHLL